MEYRLLLYFILLWLTVDPLYVHADSLLLPARCNSTLSQDLSDELFTALSDRGPGYKASDAKADRNGWVSSSSFQYEYLQLNFNKTVEITGLRMTKTSIGWYPRSLRISISQDGLVWKAYNSRLSEETLGETFQEKTGGLIEILLDPTIKTQYIALNPTSYSGYPCMRLEVFGCDATDATPQPVVTRIDKNIESHNDEWIPSQSPIVIDRPIAVGPTASLTIHAGVTVVFNSKEAGIRVYGKLKTAGIAGLETMFTSNYPVLSAKDRWEGLKLVSAGNLTLVHTKVRQAETGIQGNGTRLKLKNCLVHSCTNAVRLSSGLELPQGDNVTQGAGFLPGADNFTEGIIKQYAILEETVTMFNQYGLKLHGLNNRQLFVFHRCSISFNYQGVVEENWDSAERNSVGSLVLFHASNISHNTYSGVHSSDTIPSSLFFLNTTITGNRQYGIYAYRRYAYSSVVNVTIVNCSLSENSNDVYLRCYWCKNATHIIQNNTFVQSSVYIVHDPRSYEATNCNLMIYNNHFSGSSKIPLNIQVPASDIMYIALNTFNATKGGITMTWNNIYHDQLASIYSNKFLHIYGESVLHMQADKLQVNFMANEIFNSTPANLLHVEKGFLSMSGNNFTNNTQHICYVKTDIAYDGEKTLTANNNYWGTDDISQIKAKICDFFLDSTKIQIKTDTIFKTSIMTELEDTSQFDKFQFFFDSNAKTYVAGGVVSAGIVVNAKVFDYPLIVNRSILIEKNVSVTVSGITVNFTENRGVTLHGDLHIGEESGSPTILQSHVGTKKWTGVNLYTSDIFIQNTHISGSKTALNFKTAGISAEITNIKVNETDNLIMSENHNGGINISITSCDMDVASYLLYLTINNTKHTNITVMDSKLSSQSRQFIFFEEKAAKENFTVINLSIRSSNITCKNRVNCVYFYGCTAYLVTNVSNSVLSTSAYFFNIQTSATNFHLQQSVLKDHSYGAYFQLCNPRNRKQEVIRKIELSRNSFYTTQRGNDIYMYKRYTYEQSHNVYIFDNTFTDLSGLRRESIYLYQRGSQPLSDQYDVYIENNKFSHVATGFAIYGRVDIISLKNNTCENGKECVRTDFRDDGFRKFLIHGNVIRNNTADGIVKLKRPVNSNAVVNITENWLVNNTGTIISFDFPTIEMNYNFFENPKAQFNVKVLKQQQSYSDEVVNASLNYWGTKDIASIPRFIYDNDYDADLLDVTYRPYLGSKNLTDIQNEKVAFLRSSGDVGGVVNGDILLTSSGSPYKVISNIEVQESDHLTLEAGVILLFGESLGMNVFGILNVNGTPTEPVLMNASVSGASWKGLEIKGNLTSTLMNLIVNDTVNGITIYNYRTSMQQVTSSFSRNNGISIGVEDQSHNFSHVIYSGLNAYNNSKTGIAINLMATLSKTTKATSTNGVTIKINECMAIENRGHGVSIEANAHVTLYGCEVNRNRGYGLHVHQRQGGTTTVQSSSFDRNINMAVYVYWNKGFILNSTTITNHVRQNYYRPSAFIYFEQTYSNEKTNVSISNSKFENNTADGIVCYSPSTFSIYIFNNTFIRGNRIIFFQQVYNSAARNVFSFNENSINSNSYVDGHMITVNIRQTSGIINISNNVFNNNSASRGMFIFLSNSALIAPDVAIQGNTFQSNEMKEAFIDIGSYPRTNIHRNIFQNDKVMCELRSPLFLNATFYINATHNYWGSRRIETVISKICGFDKQMDRTFVYYMPFYGDEILGHLEGHKHNVFDIAGGRGGEITADMVISKKTSSFTNVPIGRSIMIRNGSMLIVEEGMTLSFERGKGIYVAGGLNLQKVTLTNLRDPWHGVVVHSKTGLSKVSDTVIENTRQGVMVQTALFDIRRSVLRNSTSDCLTMQFMFDKIYDFQGTLLQNCSKAGVVLLGDGNMTIVNTTVENAYNGILSKFGYGKFSLRSSTFRNTTDVAVSLRFTNNGNGRRGNITIENCSISNSSKGIEITVDTYQSDNSILINRNMLTDISDQTLSIKFPTYYWSTTNLRTVDVGYNTFQNSCFVSTVLWNHVNFSFHDNTISNCSCDRKEVTYYLDVIADASADIPHRVMDISSNVFSNLSATYIVRLQGSLSDYVFNGSLNYNQFLDNKATESVVLLDTKHFNISQNIFDSPGSLFNLYVDQRGSDVVNASNNWWGSPDIDQAYTRIFDSRFQPDLLTVNITPILTESTIDCTGVNNCSSKGECISKNRCRCHSGWQGETCSDYDCAGVNNCYDNGVCTGPNQCQCNYGWSGQLCIDASCSKVNDCSGHGICLRPDICRCAERFTGIDCSACVAQHWGPMCQPCPACVNGACDLNTGKCICKGSNWAGSLCDRCNETFYGPNCLPLMMALSLMPNEGLDTGGNIVHVWGHNFPESSYKCKFGTDIVNGTWVAWNHVTCPVPQHEEGDVTLEISADGVTYTDNKLIYSFYATCPPGSCGKSFTPPRGQCLFGGCSCILPWVGENCEKELLAPVIQEPEIRQTVSELGFYKYSLQLSQGDAPVRWELKMGPDGMTLNERTTSVEWQYAFARAEAYVVQVIARNIIGSDMVEWEIVVPLSYSAVASIITPNGILPSPKSVQISGEVMFADPNSTRVVPVDVVVRNDVTVVKVLQTLTNPLVPTSFVVTYDPRPDDAGVFNVDAKHPAADIKGDTTLSWTVKGMKCDPHYISWYGIIDGNVAVYENISSLINTGGIAIDTISSRIDGLPGAFVRKSGTTSNTQPFLSQLYENGHQSFDLVVTDPRPLSGTIYIIFTSAEGLSARMQVYIQLSIRKPLLIFNPSVLKENVNRGSQKVIEVEIANMGEVSARNVKVDIPKDPKLSLVAFAVVDDGDKTNDTDKTNDFVIPPNGKAVLSISVTVNSTEALGEMSGRIAVNTDLTGGFIPYRFYITSLQTLTLTVTVTDEYTYFASGNPKVAGAKVFLMNPRRSYNEEQITTNVAGSALFEDIYEDKYTLYVEAEDHSSYSAVILASSDNVNVEAFLKRTAVKYEWTVTPTTVQDTYVITLDSTFETFVPMPVVTIEPAKVNTIPIELGQKDTIEFTITNHGLIKADNIRFVLPDAHPYLTFELATSSIGDLDANTTIVVPVKAKLRPRVKRNTIATAICGLAMLYDLYCGGLQTYDRGVTLTREYPGRPPLPCGLGGGGGGGSGGGGGGGGGVSYSGGGGPGSGSGTSVDYNPVTPLSCDCATNLIKSCALAYNSFAGCASARIDLSTSLTNEKTRGSIVLGTLSLISALADTAMACKFGFICELCGLFYTTVRCLIEADNHCGGLRRRREISTDVVNNMLNVAQPMDNFLQIMEEILGDENMYNIGREWYGDFKTTIADESDSGSLLSATEVSSVLAAVSDESNRETLSRFLQRWNNTAAAWNNGTLNEMTDRRDVINLSRLSPRFEQYLNDVDTAKDKGFDSIFDEYDYAVSAYKTAEQDSKQTGGKDDSSVCAKVRVRIVQELVLTRDAFNAKLEIENGESSALEDIHVEIQIRKTYGSGELANENFSIGSPQLVGITGVDGSGSLGQDISGTAEWLIIPYSSAAPEEDTLYDVGGVLSYRVGSSKISVTLLPDAVTVKSNPSLVVHYFHEKYVRGDDPLTTEVEPIVPFSLCVLVMNNGYGIANALKITSGQPEIIENEKGLLISFKIVGAQLESNPISPSLTVDFGDIMSFETKSARWLLTSTLKGTFYNYSATFENINPLGDPQLSLLDELGYHELIHLVIIEDNNDKLDDFLVNDIIDEDGMPDKLYNSVNGTDVHDVSTANVTAISESSFIRSGSKGYTVIHLNVTVQNGSEYHYVRVENNITSPRPGDQQYLIHASREDGRELIVDKNVWQTTHIFDTFFIHIFDSSENIYDADEWRYVTYNLTYGPRNMYAPKFNATSYSTTLPKESQVGTPVLVLAAFDIDKDSFTFALVNTTIQMFTVNKKSGEILLNRNVSYSGTYEFEVEVEDQGIPAKSSSVMVSVSISGDISSSTTTMTSSTISTSTKLSTAITSSTTDVSSTTLSSSSSTTTSPSSSTSSSTQSTTKSPVSTSTSITTLSSSTGPSTSTSSSTYSSTTSTASSTQSTTKSTAFSTSTTSSTQSSTKSPTSSTEMSTTSSSSTGPSSSSFSPTQGSTTSTAISSTVSTSAVPRTETTTTTTAGSSTSSSSTSMRSASSVSTDLPVSSSTANVTVEERKGGDIPSWVIPTAIGGGVAILLVIIAVLFVYMLRVKTAGTMSRNGTYYMG